MALPGIGAEGGSPLEKFQQMRDLARKKIDGDDSRAKLGELLQRKQKELGGVGKSAAKAPAFAASPVPAKAAQASPASAQALSAPSLPGAGAYGRAGSLEKPDPKPKLGRYVDFMA